MYSALPASADRVRCPDCFGRRSSQHGDVIAACRACMANFRPCPLHACQTCDGRGAVCPVCRGARFCRVPDPRGRGNVAEPCAVCAAGETAILRAIDGYMEDHHA